MKSDLGDQIINHYYKITILNRGKIGKQFYVNKKGIFLNYFNLNRLI